MKCVYILLSRYLPHDIIRSMIVPYFTALERLGIHDTFEKKLAKQLKYPRDTLSGKSKRLCSYLNTIHWKKYSGVSVRGNQFIIKNNSRIFLHRYNYSTFSYFYFENQVRVQNTPNDHAVILKLMKKYTEMYDIDMQTIRTTNDFYASSVSNKCQIGYNDSTENHLGPRQLFRILYDFNRELEIYLKHSQEDRKAHVGQNKTTI